MSVIRRPWGLSLSLAAVLVALAIPVHAAEPVDDFVIQCRTSCDSVAAAIRQIDGARINYTFRNVPGLAASIPVSAAASLQKRTDVVDVSKDLDVASPLPRVDVPLAADEARVLSPSALPGFVGTVPANYNYNNGLTGAAALHAQGTLGNGVLVAVIDSGTANNATVVPALAGSVIGGESLIPPAEDPFSATSTQNDPHGTWVGTMIAGHANFLFSSTSTLVRAIQQHSPSSVLSCATLGCPSSLSVVPMIGTAPAAKIYAIKILPSDGGSTPSSRTLAAMDRVLTLRRNFDNGVPSVPLNPGCGAETDPCVYDSLPIQVVNMSLGGGTLNAGNDLKDKLTVDMLNAGMVVTVAAGNDGPGALTIGSPASGRGALDVAAASTPVHERILRDIQFGLGIGALWRPFNGIQTATFSSRGPTPDGRISINITANGDACFVQSANGNISLASGTSFSSPTVAGAAALLRERFPNVSAAKIRGALIQSANPSVLADGSGAIDRGAGFLDIPAAVNLLSSGAPVRTHLELGLSSPFMDLNLLLLGITPVRFTNDVATKHLTNLKPGQMAQLYLKAEEDTESFQITLSNITPTLPAAQQNQLFGDDLFVTILDSYTSFKVPLVEQFVASDSTFTVTQPTSGYVRLAIQGDNTNAGTISADVTITRVRNNLGALTATGKVRQGEADTIKFDVPAGTARLTGLLEWIYNWGGYPTNDIDLYLIDPNGNIVAFGATLGSPERAEVLNPVPGRWSARVEGFSVQDTLFGTGADFWRLWVKADGQRLRQVR
jgi:hypothetical protein